MAIRSLGTGLVLILSSAAFAADWPQFGGGPERTNQSSETGLVTEWPAGGPKVLWTTKVGEGFGGPAIVDGQVFILDRSGPAKKEQDVLRVLDLSSGEELWSYSYDAPGRTQYPGSRTVPAVTPKHVFSVGPWGHLLCIDRQTRQPVWQTNIIKPGTQLPPWAIAQAPLVYRDMVIVSLQGGPGLTAYDQATGNVLWQAQAVPGTAYSSPALITIDGKEQIILCHGNGVSAVDPADGSVLWAFDGWKCAIPIPSPLALGDGRIFLTGGYRAGSAMISVKRDGDTYGVRELWRTKHGSQIHQPLLIDGCIYFNGTTNEAQDGLVCLDPETGALLWQTKAAIPPERGNLIYADGLIYFIDRAGALHTIKPSKEKLQKVSSAKLLAGKDIWTPMALSNGKLVIRDQTQMKCLDLSSSASAASAQ